MNFVKVCLFVLFSLTAAAAWAHPGHDHNSVFATLVHLLWVLPVIAAIAVGVYFTKKDTEEER